MQLTVISVSRVEDDLIVIAQCPYAQRPRKVLVGGMSVVAPDWDPAELQTVTMQVPLEAIPDRQAAYGLDSPRKAMLALMREQAKALNNLPDGDESTPVGRNPVHVRRWGGLRGDVNVVIAPKAATALAALRVDD